MTENNDKITNTMLIAIIINTLIGIGIVSLPSGVAEKAGVDGWVLVVLGGIIVILVVVIMARLGSLFPGETFVEYSRTVLSAPAGILLSLGFALYFVIFTAFEARLFAEILKQFLLDNTPTEIIMVTMLLASAYLVRQGIEVIGRLAELLVPVILIPYFLLILPIVPDMDFTNFLPLFKTPPLTIITGTVVVVTSYLGFETILLFYPFVNRPRYVGRALVTGVAVVMADYLLVVVASQAIFGVKGLRHIIWPSLTVLRAVDIPGAFLENVYGIMMAIWVAAIYFTLSMFYFSGVFTIGRILRLEDYKFLVLPLVPVLYVIALVPDNIARTYDLLDMFSMYLGIPYAFVIPVMLYIIARIRGFKEGKGEDRENTVEGNN